MIRARAVLLAAPAVTSAPPPDNVVVINGEDRPVPASIVGTPSVSIDGTPSVSVAGIVTVQPAREPFQQFVTGFSTGGEDCDELTVPAGKRLTLETLSVDGDGTVAPHVYILITAATGGGASFVRAVEVDLQPAISSFAGVADVLLHTGTPSPGAHTYSLQVCVAPGPGASSGGYRGFASGWLEDA